MAMPMPRRRFTVADYERMGMSGILTEDDRVELIAGEIIEMSPIGVPHMQCVNRLNRMLNRQVGDDLVVSVQNPIHLPIASEPQPDLVVLYDRAYQSIPTAADVLFVIEVADSSRDYDRGVTFPLYAAAGIREAWLVDLGAETIERHTKPHGGRDRLIALAGRGESLASTTLPALMLAVDTLLG